MITTKYGKLVDGRVQYMPIPLPVSGVPTWTNDPAIYAGEGYLPVEHHEKPIREGYWYELTWVEQDGKIVQTWVEHENTTTDEIPDSEALAIITGGAV